MMTSKDLWERARADLQVSLSTGNFNMWFKNASIVEAREVGEDRAIVVMTSASAYHVTMLENRFYAQIKEALDGVSKRKCELQFRVAEQRIDKAAQPNIFSDEESQQRKKISHDKLPQPELFSQQPHPTLLLLYLPKND